MQQLPAVSNAIQVLEMEPAVIWLECRGEAIPEGIQPRRALFDAPNDDVA